MVGWHFTTFMYLNFCFDVPTLKLSFFVSFPSATAVPIASILFFASTATLPTSLVQTLVMR